MVTVSPKRRRAEEKRAKKGKECPYWHACMGCHQLTHCGVSRERCPWTHGFYEDQYCDRCKDELGDDLVPSFDFTDKEEENDEEA